MLKRILSLLLPLILLSACAASPPARDVRLRLVATTYPISLFAQAVCAGMEDVDIQRLDTGETSCLHDYTLTVRDMKKLDRADVIALNGAGLEDFLEDALATSSAPVIDCSRGVPLLENRDHDHEEEEDHQDHDHGHWDPHIWMDPGNACRMVSTLAEELAALDPERAEIYRSNGEAAISRLEDLDRRMGEILSPASGCGLITFHDGFQYFSAAYSLPLLEAIEEEAGSEASAREIVEVTGLVREHALPVIFTEVNGSDATARAIARETGCQVATLSMIMDGPQGGTAPYEEAMLANAEAVVSGFSREEAVS